MSNESPGWPDVDLLDRTRLRDRMLIGLGRAGDARMYHAAAPLGQLVVADWLVKVYKRLAAGDADADPVVRDRPALELAANAAVAHSNCASLERIHDVIHYDGYQLMCFPSRGDAVPLAQTLAHKRLLPLAPALYIVELLADAVRAVHQCQIVHRNIHPWSAIIRWDRDWPSAMLTDLSCAKFLGEGHAELSCEPVGGPDAYRAPEQQGTREHGLACDIYTLGRMVYEILAGQLLPEDAFGRRSHRFARIFSDRPPRLSKFRSGLLPEFANVVERCLADEPRIRPTAKELMDWARSARIASQTGKLIWPDELEAKMRSLGR